MQPFRSESCYASIASIQQTVWFPLRNTPAIKAFKAYLQDPDREDACHRQADPGYWGDAGTWIKCAVSAIEAALDSLPATTDVADWLAAVVAALEEAQADFRRNESDPDGYGSATFTACLTRCYKLQTCYEENWP